MRKIYNRNPASTYARNEPERCENCRVEVIKTTDGDGCTKLMNAAQSRSGDHVLFFYVNGIGNIVDSKQYSMPAKLAGDDYTGPRWSLHQCQDEQPQPRPRPRRKGGADVHRG